MNQKSPRLFISDIMQSIEKIEHYIESMSFETFIESNMVIDAVIRNLEVIGEASKNIPDEVKGKYPDIPWKRMIGLRNIVIHEYFGVDFGIVWEIITRNLPATKPEIIRMLKDFTDR